ncbi:hypothetical protein [Anaerosporobacter sp.]
MSEIKIVKSGIDCYEKSEVDVHKIWLEIESLEKNLKTSLDSGEWKGESCEKCKTLLKLTAEYRRSIIDIFGQMNTHEKDLVTSSDRFTNSAIGSL